jgi:hypothetical protein
MGRRGGGFRDRCFRRLYLDISMRLGTGGLGGEVEGRDGDVQGCAYSAAIPARKSRARSLPPVAEAAYGP